MVRKDVGLFCLFVLLNLLVFEGIKRKVCIVGFFLNINNGKGL